MKEEILGSALNAQEEVKLFKKEKDVTWRFNGNRVQFEFNDDIAGRLKQIDWSIEQGKTGYGRESIAETLTNIQKQRKLICIADTSEGGWDTVKLYESNPVASDSEDEAKINRAENKAVKKKKNATKGNKRQVVSDDVITFPPIHAHEIEALPEVFAGEVELLPGILRKSRAESTCSKLGFVQSVRE
ncbi:hypothetical protein DPMN_064779 [Dreissena polymorpha]|uniref:Uncharacterized protein n=1 Tax=Dreissena polymorpha TaxID=45954 RepID=A0A9D4CDY2_DREPO|nr:hypothetical protein DPMN_064779 [Dreissena polymorpha]